MARKKSKTKFARRKVKGLQAPSFEGWENLEIQKFHTLKRSVSDFYYMNFKHTENIENIFTWMAENGYSKLDISSAKKAAKFENLTGIYCRMLLDGCPDFVQAEDDYWQTLPGTGGHIYPITDYVKPKIAELIEKGRHIVEEKKIEEKAKKNVYIPSIQERITEQAREQAEKIDEWLDEFIKDADSFDPKGFNFKKHFQQMKVSQAHARKLKGFYAHELDDYKELDLMPSPAKLKKLDEHTQDMWAQLKEGYAHRKKADIKKYTTAIEELMSALDFVIDSAKATRKPRKAKPKSATKLVEKIKYLKTDDKYKLASVAPEEIIGCNELWVFNVKTRKLGKYVAKNIDPKGMAREGTGLSVKGTTIQGYNENESIQKTVRKPEETLKEFKSAGKVKLRKFLDDIKTTDIKLNGRLNTDTIILKCML